MARIAFVTGARGGIGAAVVRRLEAEAWSVVSHESPREPAAVHPGNERTLTGDLATESGLHDAVTGLRGLLRETDEVKLAVLCAAACPEGSPVSYAECERAARLNVIAPYLLTEYLAPLMHAPAMIVMISSAAASRSSPGLEFYGATKAALNALVSLLGYRFAPSGIRTIGIAPTLVRTPMSERVWQDDERVAEYLTQQPYNRFADPDDIAALVSLVAREEATWLTGQVLAADGGLLLGFLDHIWDSTGTLNARFRLTSDNSRELP